VLDRLSCFVEEVTVHALQGQMPAGISVTKIPVALGHYFCFFPEFVESTRLHSPKVNRYACPATFSLG